MARDEGNAVTQGPKLGLDGVNERLVVTAWKIRAADGTTRQNVSDLSELQTFVRENHVSRCVAGAMTDAE